MTENFTNAKHDPLVAAAAKILTGCTQLDETAKLQEVSKGKLVDILKKEGWKSMDMKDLDDAIRKAKVNTPLGDVIGAWSKADKIVLFYDDGTSDFVSLRDRKITSTKDLWFGNPSKLAEALKTPTYPHVRKVMNVAEDLDEATDDLGTATIVAPSHEYHGKTVRIFYKFDDGRINVQYKKSNKKGDLINLTLKKGQYKIDEETIDEAIDKSDYREVSRAFDTVYGAFSPVSTFYKSLVKTNRDYKSDLEQIRKHLLAIDAIWQDMKSELDESTIAEAAPKGNYLEKLNDISKIIADKEKRLQQLEKQRQLAQKEYDALDADLYVLFDKRDELHDILKDSDLGFSKSQIDKAYKGKL